MSAEVGEISGFWTYFGEIRKYGWDLGEISGFGTRDNGEIRPVGVVGLRDLGRGSKQRFRTIRGVFPQNFRLRRLFTVCLAIRRG